MNDSAIGKSVKVLGDSQTTYRRDINKLSHTVNTLVSIVKPERRAKEGYVKDTNAVANECDQCVFDGGLDREKMGALLASRSTRKKVCCKIACYVIIQNVDNEFGALPHPKQVLHAITLWRKSACVSERPI